MPILINNILKIGKTRYFYLNHNIYASVFFLFLSPTVKSVIVNNHTKNVMLYDFVLHTFVVVSTVFQLFIGNHFWHLLNSPVNACLTFNTGGMFVHYSLQAI